MRRKAAATPEQKNNHVYVRRSAAKRDVEDWLDAQAWYRMEAQRHREDLGRKPRRWRWEDEG